MSSTKVFALLLIMLALLSCAKDPFSTRDNELPTKKPGTFIPPTAPAIVLENLRLSYSELVIGNFIQCLDSNFTFRFDFVQTTPGDTSWGFNQEVALTQKMFNEFSSNKEVRRISIEFVDLPDQSDILLDTAATLIRSYTLSVTDTLGTVQDNFHGVARFDLVESAFNFWSLRRWEDLHSDTQVSSWAEFKNAFR
ncbi:MAG: hypothetical protein WBP29_06895 [Candidatus Zixiibacteriota bacterium]